MAEHGLDAIVVAKPESFAWATGAPPGVASFFRRAGAALALIPADPGRPVSAVTTELFAPSARAALGEAHVLTHPDWVECADIRPWLDSDKSAAQLTELAWQAAGRAQNFERPGVFDARLAFSRLSELLQREGLQRSQVGLDLDFWPVADFALLKQLCPQPLWRDASAALSAIKAVKSPREIAKLQSAASLAEAGMHCAIAEVREGTTRDAIAAAWKAGVCAEMVRTGQRITGQWEYTSVGPTPWTGGGIVQRGDVIKFDVGCLVDGYSSDSGRTYTCGPARPRTREIMRALSDAFAAGIEVLRPGYLLSDVHQRATDAMKRAGFDRFSRGHFGHSLGHDTFCEVPPFIASQAHTPIEPGMVLAFETPFYVDGEGGFIIEDQFLITDTGAQVAWSLDRDLVELG
jgi:Xaa-Pro aminopeptidase